MHLKTLQNIDILNYNIEHYPTEVPSGGALNSIAYSSTLWSEAISKQLKAL